MQYYCTYRLQPWCIR